MPEELQVKKDLPLEEPMAKLCKRGTDIWLNHNYGPGWKCTRCGFQIDTKKLFSQ